MGLKTPWRSGGTVFGQYEPFYTWMYFSDHLYTAYFRLVNYLKISKNNNRFQI